MLAMLFESLAFVYVGLALPSLGSQGMKDGWHIALILVVLCVTARAVSTSFCVSIINFLRPAATRVSKSAQFVIWLAGLRGGVAYALAKAAAKVVTDP